MERMEKKIYEFTNDGNSCVIYDASRQGTGLTICGMKTATARRFPRTGMDAAIT